MRKKLIVLIMIAGCTLSFAQMTNIDALKFIQTDINGTARYVGMAGAFGALGGDPSAIKDNPAGLGIYRRSDLSTSLNLLTQGTRSNWDGNIQKDCLYKGKLDNISYILALPTWAQVNGESKGLLYSNFSFSYNRLKNFDRNMIISGNGFESSLTDYMADLVNGAEVYARHAFIGDDMTYNNEHIAWLSVLGYKSYLINELFDNNGKHVGWGSELSIGEKTVPTYRLQERGYVDEYALAWSGNFSNRFYLGASFNISAINYRISSSYREDLVNRGNDYFVLRNDYTALGIGVNLKLGAIYRLSDAVRLGFSYQIPTYLIVEEQFAPTVEYSINHSTENRQREEGYSPVDGGGTFQIKKPMQLNASAAYLFGSKGLLSAEYVYNAYGNTRFYDENGNSNTFEYENSTMKDVFQGAHTIKIGAEYRLTDFVSLRGGFATTTAATKSDAAKNMFTNTIHTNPEYFLHKSTNYFTAGAGYRNNNWYFDLGYMHKRHNESFMPYNWDRNLLPAANVVTSNNNIVATIGLRF